LPWEQGSSGLGFGPSETSWLPQPESYRALARDAQESDPRSTLNLYKQALATRKELKLGQGSFDWVSTGDLLSYQNQGVIVVHNFGQDTKLPLGEILISSDPDQGHTLRANQTLWLKV
jgi:alpha-glucosidase